jgi:hypothetical protein
MLWADILEILLDLKSGQRERVEEKRQHEHISAKSLPRRHRSSQPVASALSTSIVDLDR